MMLAALLAVLVLSAAGCGDAEAGSPPDLDAVRDRILADSGALAAEGFHVRTAGVRGDRVAIGLITARDDHADYFRERYGPVDTEVIATELHSIERNEIDGYRADGRSLTLFYGTGGGAALERVEVDEGADRVEVAIVERVPNGPRTLELKLAEETVRLERPLGDRAVIDRATGRRVRRCDAPSCPDAPGRERRPPRR